MQERFYISQFYNKITFEGKRSFVGFVFILSLLSGNSYAQNVSINATGAQPDSSAMLDVSDTARGFLMPRLTATQQAAIVNPAPGLMIYNTTDSAFHFYDGNGWSNTNLGAKSILPVGSIISYGGDTSAIPNGYLMCNGLSLDTGLYAPLFAAIGYNWGGSLASFNLPDLRGKFIRGTDLGAGNDPDAASRTGGDNVGSMQVDATSLPNTNFTTNTTGAHTHTYKSWDGNNTDLDFSGGADDARTVTANTGSSGNHSHSITGGGDNETRPINANVNFIICYDSEIAQAGGTSSAGSLTQTLTFASPNLSISGGNSVDLSSLASFNTSGLDSVLFAGNDANGDSILNVGAIGIGTSAPSAPLTVQTTGNAFGIEHTDGSVTLTTFTNGSEAWFGTTSNSALKLFIDGNTAADLTVDTTGNVGIGTENPTELFDVAGTATIDTLNINSAFTFPTTDGTSGQVMTTDGAGNVTWENAGSGTSDELSDADNDTKIQVEESNDEDVIRFDIAGTEYFQMDSGHFKVLNTGNSVFIGDSAGFNDDLTNNNNTILGFAAGKNLTTGNSNVFVGYRSGLNTTGSGNVAVGSEAMTNLGSDFDNVAVGNETMQQYSGEGNIAMGYQSLRDGAGDFNLALGYGALYNSGSPFNGSDNVAIGNLAGADNDGGSNNVFIGKFAGQGEGSVSNKLYIGNQSQFLPLIYGNFTDDSVKIHGRLTLDSAAGNDYTFPGTRGTSGQVLTSDGTGNVTWQNASGSSLWTNSGSNTYLSTGTRLGVGTTSPNAMYVATLYANGGGVGQGGLFINNSVNGNTRKKGVYTYLDDGGNKSKIAFRSFIDGKSSGNDTLASYVSNIRNDNSGDLGFGLYSDFETSVGTNYGVYTTNEDYNYFSGNTGFGSDKPIAPIDVDSTITMYGSSSVSGNPLIGFNVLYDGNFKYVKDGQAGVLVNGIGGFGMHFWPDGTGGTNLNSNSSVSLTMKDSTLYIDGGDTDSLMYVEGNLRANKLTVGVAYSLPTSAPTASGQTIVYDGSSLGWGNGGAADLTAVLNTGSDGGGDSIYNVGMVSIGTTDTTSNFPLKIQAHKTYNGHVLQILDTTGTRAWHARLQGTNNQDLAWTESDVADNRFVMEAGGEIGINVDAPQGQLHVNTSGFTALNLSGSNTVGTWASIGNSSSGGKYYQIISTGSGNGEGAGKLLFGYGASLGAVSGIPMVLADNKVGIGTSSPDELLDVQGNINVKDAYILERTASAYVSDSRPKIFGGGSGTFNPGDLILQARTNHSSGVGDIIFATGASNVVSTKMIIQSNGNVGIGIAAPTHILHINGSGRSTSTLWAVTSDERAKQNVETITDATDLLMKFRPVTYEWKPEYKEKYQDEKPYRYGFISQEAEQIIPSMVTEIVETTPSDTIYDFKVLDQEPLIPLLVRAIQEQQAEIERLIAENETLKAENSIQKNDNANLQNQLNENNQRLTEVSAALNVLISEFHELMANESTLKASTNE